VGIGRGRGGREGGEERGEGSEGTGREERRRGGEETPQGLVHTLPMFEILKNTPEGRERMERKGRE